VQCDVLKLAVKYGEEEHDQEHDVDDDEVVEAPPQEAPDAP
jgi:hypothetical protein